MAEPSTNSAPRGKKSTGITGSELTPVDALGILAKALDICEKAGLPVYLTPIYEGGLEHTGIILRQVKLEGRQLKYTGKYTGNQAENTGEQP
jgi:hypothetical protein